MKELINASDAPAAIGPYSHGTRSGNLLFTSGQIPLDPASGEVVGSNVTEQARQTLTNLKAVLAAGGSSLGQVLKTTCFLATMDDFLAFNEVYTEFFGEGVPARSCVAVAGLPKAVLCEVEAIATID